MNTIICEVVRKEGNQVWKIIMGKLAFKWKVTGVEEFPVLGFWNVSLILPLYLAYISHKFYFSCQDTQMCNPIQWRQESVYIWASIEQILLFLVLVRLDIVLWDLFLIVAYCRSRKWSDVFFMFHVGIWEDERKRLWKCN